MKRQRLTDPELRLIILGIGFSLLPGCEPENEPPTAKLEVTPITAEVPAQIRMKVTGQDPDGVSDIKQYVLYIGNENVKSNTPIDITRTFTNAGTIKIYGKVTDSENQINQTPAKSLELVLGPYIEQSASLINENEITYSATVNKKTNAVLTIKRDGTAFLTLPIPDVNSSGVDFQKTFKFSPDGITKGNYEFELKADDLEKIASVQVPNYKPTTNLSGLETDLNEGVEKTITLPTPLDKNPEDNPVAIKSAKSLDDKTQVTLDGYNLKIKPLTYTGDYQVEIEFGSAVGGLEKAILQGNVIDDPRMIFNPFKSTNSNGAAYDLLTTKSQRDIYLQQKLFEDWADAYHIPYNPNPLWNCTQYGQQGYINLHGFLNPELYVALPKYSGDNLDSIYYYGGTIKDNGKYGLPVYFVYLSGEGTEHNMNAILTGNDLTKFEDWNFIEPQRDSINVKPGRLYMPKNCSIWIRGPLKKNDGTYFDLFFQILEFKVENGIGRLNWINEDSNLNIIRTR